MIAKFTHGQNFEKMLAYVFRDGAKVIKTLNLSSDPSQWVRNFELVARGVLSMKHSVMHFSLSARIGVTLTEEQWITAAQAFLLEIDPDIHLAQWLVVHHSDKDHDHVHIVVGSRKLDGKAIPDFKMKYRCCSASSVAASKIGQQPIARLGEHASSNLGLAAYIRDSVDELIKNGIHSFEQFKNQLSNEKKILVKLIKPKVDGGPVGICYIKTGHRPMTGSALDKGSRYTVSGLKSRGLVISV